MNDSALAASITSRSFRSNLILDLFGVVVLPAVCFAVDFYIQGVILSTSPATVWTFAIFGAGILLLSYYPSLLRYPVSVISGMLAMTAFCTLLLGLVLLPFSVAASFFYWIGLLGIVPFLTSWRFFKRWRKLAPDSIGAERPSFAIGLIIAIIPTALMLASERVGEGHRIEDLTSRDPQRVLRVLRQTHAYNISDLVRASPFHEISTCLSLDALPLDNTEVATETRRIIGAGSGPLADHCRMILDD